MRDTYYLRDKNNYVVAKIEVEKATSYNVDLLCWECYSWVDGGEPFEYHFFADAYFKWDSCTHWNFHGEDYDPDDETEDDCYYHICGDHCFTNHIRTMCFMWKTAAWLMRNLQTEENVDYKTFEYYHETDEIRQLIDFILKDYKIEKVNSGGD